MHKIAAAVTYISSSVTTVDLYNDGLAEPTNNFNKGLSEHVYEYNV